MSADMPNRLFLEGWRPYAWIAGVIAILYSKSLFFGYTYLDDTALILVNHDFLSKAANIGQAFLQKVFADSYLPYYRPILTVSLILDAQIGGTSPFFYHATNILFHVAASCLVLLLLARLGYGRKRSFIFGMIFAVHPVLSQGVAWIPGRNDTIMAVFLLASFISLMEMLRTERVSYYAWHLALFLLAIFTKETALVLIPVSLVYLYLVAKEKLFSRNVMVLAAGWAVCICLWHSFRQVAVRDSMDITVIDAWTLLVAYLPAAIQFTGKIFFPFNLSVFPIIQDTTFLYGVAASAALFLAFLLTSDRRYNYIIFGLSWAILFMLPSLMRVNYKVSADFLEHRVYVPMIGFFILVLETDLVKKAKGAALIAAAGLIIFGFASIAFNHMDNFRGRLAFWSNAVMTSPHSTFARINMGHAYFEDGRLGAAEDEFRKCLAIDPLEPASLFNMGEIYLKKGLFQEAQAFFRKTLAVYPFYDNAYLELGALYYKQGKFEKAEWAWKRTIEMNPKNVAANKFLAIFYHERKDYDKARQHVKRLKAMGVTPPPGFMKSLGAE
jgi:tetratricopeptide (TPR) repeat protein